VTAANPYGEPPPGGDSATTVLIMLARVEGKLDVVAAQHGAQLTEHTRRIDDQERRSDGLDDRVRALEIRPTVSPRQMLGAAVGVAAIVGVVSPFLDRLYS